MAQDVGQHDLPDEVVYDSQEEEDQWPESQSTVQDAVELPNIPKRPPVLKVYGRTKVILSMSYLSDRDLTDKSRVDYC